MDDFFKTDSSIIQLISSGEYIDDDPNYEGDTYTVRVYALRLNPTALSEWGRTQILNHRNTYSTEGEWKAYKAKKEKLQTAFQKKVAELLNVNLSLGSLFVTQAVSEAFTAVHIFKNPQPLK